MIAAAGLSRAFGGREVLHDVSLRVDPGEVVGLLGPNGAGKTTLIRLLLGVLRPSAGTAGIDGPAGYLPERFSAYDGLTVAGHLRYLARLKGLGGRRASGPEVARVMEAADLTELARRPVGRLSKGQRQRVGLAQALLGAPPAYALDEPTAGLDPQQVVHVRSLVRSLAGAERPAAVLVSTHLLAEAAAMCDRVVVLVDGRVRADEAVTGAAELEERFLRLVAGAAPLSP